MAQALVEEMASFRYFCHLCSVEITPVMPEISCPHCSLGFIEFFRDTEDHRDSDTNIEVNQSATPTVSGSIVCSNSPLRLPAGPERIVLPYDARESNSSNRQPGQTLSSQNVTYLGPGIGTSGVSVRHGVNTPTLFFAPEFYHRNSIATQTHNHGLLEETGAPPLAKDTIDKIPKIELTKQQVHQSLRCSVCLEDFHIKESVRQLPCEHVFHENCIIPWLELHGTCPVCRKCPSYDSSDGQNVGNDVQRLRLPAEDESSSENSSDTASCSTMSSQNSHELSDVSLDQVYD